ncbi:Crp/Fnr family transcriptional regulator [Xylanibacter brevis]|uniref:Crp/Fnr family transcriptional regulator n=1 Tax=Xylanibacter brevis TaxID=83231 RepID=UPI0005C51D9A|nr:Crp/Fnr family transcriptional regulator [Xylanibacter brevis]
MRIYDQLLQFPLFQGMSRAELLQLAGNTKFGFQKQPPRKTIIREGDTCSQLLFLISGKLEFERQSDDHTYMVTEQVHAPWLVQPEVLFGAQPQYLYTVNTLTEAHFILLSKDEVLRLLDDFLIFRLNMLNLLSTQSQRRAHLPWRRAPKSLRERIVRFMLDHCTYPAGQKEFHILMRHLAQEVGDSRLDVSRELNAMQNEGLLQLARGRIIIPSLERLFM